MNQETNEFPPPPSELIIPSSEVSPPFRNNGPSKPRGFRSVSAPISNDPNRKQWYKSMFKQMHGREYHDLSDITFHKDESLVQVVQEEDKRIMSQQVKVDHISDNEIQQATVTNINVIKPAVNKSSDNVKRHSNPFIPKSPLDFVTPVAEVSSKPSNNIERHSNPFIPKSPLDFVTPSYEKHDPDFVEPKKTNLYKERSDSSEFNVAPKSATVGNPQPSSTTAFAYPPHKQVAPMNLPTKVTKTRKQSSQLPKESVINKEKALVKFTFNGKSEKELCVKKDDIIFILKQVDSNWYLAEADGGSKQGIIPIQYVEKVTQSTAVEKTVVTPGKAKVKFDFNGKSKRELTVKKGMEIELLSKVDKNWYKGKHESLTGLVPAVYIDVIVEPVKSKIKRAAGDKLNKSAAAPNTSPEKSKVHTSTNECHETKTKNDVINELKFNVNNILHQNNIVENNVGTAHAEIMPSNLPVEHLLIHNNNTDLPPSIPSEPSYASSIVSSQSSRIASPVNTPSEYGVVIGNFKALYPYVASNDDEIDLIAGDIIAVVEICDDGWYVGTCQRTNAFGTFPGNFVSNL